MTEFGSTPEQSPDPATGPVEPAAPVGAAVPASPAIPSPTPPSPGLPSQVIVYPLPGEAGVADPSPGDPDATPVVDLLADPEVAPGSVAELSAFGPNSPRRGRSRLNLPAMIVVAAVIGLLAGLLGGFGGYKLAQRSTSNTLGTISLPQVTAGSSSRASDTIAGIAKAVLPSVVSIQVSNPNESAAGSGFVIRSDGYILTNNHVAAPAAQPGGTMTVQFQNGVTKPGTIVGVDPSYDLAVVKVDLTGLSVATLGNSDGVQVGDTAVAIGSPLGLAGTVTSGIISALNRPVTAGDSATGASSAFIDAIQTDAAINPGNSGGPLVNGSGQVIGVNSAIASLGASAQGSQSGSIGLGFAIPINQAKRVAEQLIATGHSTHPVIGVSLDLGFSGSGARIAAVTPGGPAAKAGLRVGSIITAVDGKAIADATELIVAIRSHVPGDTLTFTVSGSGSSTQVKVVLSASS